MHGWINLDKPLQMSSALVVDKVKKLLNLKKLGIKIGHGGTLDPLATGVLPLALGEATKLIPYAMDATKAYSFTVRWGEERDTDDGEGMAVATSDQRPALSEIEAILPRFTGEIDQLPPAFSAIKKDGIRAYDAARSGEALELEPRKVIIEKLSIQHADLAYETTFLCHCGKGTYIRSLARDMGRALGVYGYVSMLRRVKVGKFNENNAISLEKLGDLVHKGDLGFLNPPQVVLDDILAITLTEQEAGLLKNGQWLEKPATLASDITVACMLESVLIAIGRTDSRFIKPERVFNILK